MPVTRYRGVITTVRSGEHVGLMGGVINLQKNILLGVLTRCNAIWYDACRFREQS